MRYSYSLILLVFLCIAVHGVSAAETYVFSGMLGTGESADGQFSGPTGVDIDDAGNVYVADAGNDRVQKFDANGNFIMSLGEGQLSNAHDVAVSDDGLIYVLNNDIYNYVHVLSADGTPITQWGDRVTADGHFLPPTTAIALDSAGYVYVGMLGGNQQINKFSSTGEFVTSWGTNGTGDGQVYGVTGIAVDGIGNVYVAEYGNHRVQKFDPNGVFLAKWGTKGIGWGTPYPGPQFDEPEGIEVDSGGNFYVADSMNCRVQKFDTNGNFIAKWGSRGSGDGQFGTAGYVLPGPADIAIGSTGTVYVSDPDNNRVQKFTRHELPPRPIADGPEIEWQRKLGGRVYTGTTIEEFYTASLTSDGGYFLVGSAQYSASGDFSSPHPGSNGDPDIWVVKLNGAGVIQWERQLGGMGEDYGYSAQQTADGGYIILGSSRSSASGDVTDTNYGVYPTRDLWVVKLDGSGTIQWQRLLGGTGTEVGRSVQQTTDGGYILLGYSSSSASGDVTGINHDPAGYPDSDSDWWLVKLDATGTILWQKLLGGRDGGRGTEHGYSVQQTTDGGFILVGCTERADGDVVGTYNGDYSDYWVVKTDAAGTIEWQKLFGGDGYDVAFSVQQATDGGYILLGESTSGPSGNVTGPFHGEPDIYGDYPADCWVLKLDSTGAIQWQRLLGGSGVDYGYSVQQTEDGGYVLLGSSCSSDSGDVTGTNPSIDGAADFWVVKLNAGGSTQWQRLLGGGGYEFGTAIRQTADGGYMVFGKSSTYDASGDVGGGPGIHWLVKLKAESAEPAPIVKQMPGAAGPPTDTNADGKYDDVNGNGRADFADVVLYFNQMMWIAANEPISAFDYNGNGRIDFADVVWLFNHL